jgi:DNA-binding MarR family transcriptional regulator
MTEQLQCVSIFLLHPLVKLVDMPIQKPLTPQRQPKTGEVKRAQGRAGSASFNARIEGIQYDVLEELTGYAVRRAQLSIYEDFSATLGVEGITPQRFSSLVIIGSNPGISQTRLAEVMGIARSGVVSIIDNFEQAGLVERQDSGDRRSYNLRLTKDGQRQLKKYKNAVREHDDRVTQQLTAEERQQLRVLLGKLCVGPKS